MWKIEPAQILLAVGLDLLLGDPRGWPHVTRLAGKLSTAYEALFARIAGRNILAGALFWIFVCGTMLGLYFLCRVFLWKLHPMLAWSFDVAVLYQTIAAMDLHRHVRAVLEPLRSGDLGAARAKLAMIVGRDTERLDEAEITRAALESLAESTNDGFVAPLFWSVAAGPAGALFFRTANTLDSMVGHRDERYEKFGKFAAHADDVLAWIPARLCAAVSAGLRHWPRIREEARAHSSPNAGWSEAALALALDVRLGGDNYYDGARVAGPVFNAAGRTPAIADLSAGLSWFWRVIALCTTILLVAAWAGRRIFS